MPELIHVGIDVAKDTLEVACGPEAATQRFTNDIVVAALPRQERGVAGSLTMVTRTVGVMGAATALTAALHAIEGRVRTAGASDAAAFEHAFSTVFLYVALLLAAFLALALSRRTWRGG